MTASFTSRIIENEPLRGGLHQMKIEAPAVAKACVPGQFVMLRGLVADWPYLKRPFSIYASDGESRIDVIYKVVGRATSIMSKMRAGDEFDAVGPLGRGFALAVGTSRAIAVAGGIGMPPIGFYCQKYVGTVDKMTMIVGAGTRDELLAPVGLAVQGVEVVPYTEDGSKGTTGTACDGLKKILSTLPAPPDSVQVVACGPKEMLHEVHNLSTDAGITTQMSVEAIMACGLGACLACAVPAAGGGYLRACKDGPVLDGGSIDWKRWLSL